MKIIQYVHWTEPGEKERLNALMDNCNSEMEFRRAIATEFQISMVDASIVFSRFKEEFIKKLKSK